MADAAQRLTSPTRAGIIARMSSSFLRRVKSGSIASRESLKSEFRALAKKAHPDAGSAGAHDAFVDARRDFEAAMRLLDRRSRARPGDSRRERIAEDRAAFYLELGGLFRRGFPRVPRHEKERAAYERRKRAIGDWLAANGSVSGERALERVEAAALALKRDDPRAFAAFRDFVLAVVEWHADGVEAARAALRLSFAPLLALLSRRARSAASVDDSLDEGSIDAGDGKPSLPVAATDVVDGDGAALSSFLGFLVADLDRGPAASRG